MMADNAKNDRKPVKSMDKDKKAKPGIGKRLLSFFTGLKAELKRVVWPDRQKLIHSTVTVLMICVIAGVTLFAIDTVLAAFLNGIGFYTTASTTAATSTVSTTVATTASGATTASTAATTAATTVATTTAVTTATSR